MDGADGGAAAQVGYDEVEGGRLGLEVGGYCPGDEGVGESVESVLAEVVVRGDFGVQGVGVGVWW